MQADQYKQDVGLGVSWPSKGRVEFINYVTRYRPDLEPVLKGISCVIQPAEKVSKQVSLKVKLI